MGTEIIIFLAITAVAVLVLWLCFCWPSDKEDHKSTQSRTVQKPSGNAPKTKQSRNQTKSGQNQTKSTGNNTTRQVSGGSAQNNDSDDHSWTFWKWFTEPEKVAGENGERYANEFLSRVLWEDDHCLRNVCIEYEGKPAEMDLVVVNKNGVFIFEVKNYVGELVGGIDDYEWDKYKTTDAGETYYKTARNPIKQVKRQVYILAQYLKYYGINVWVEGYAYLVNNNSPVEDKTIVRNLDDVNNAIHFT